MCITVLGHNITLQIPNGRQADRLRGKLKVQVGRRAGARERKIEALLVGRLCKRHIRENAETAAEHGLGRHLPCEANSWSPAPIVFLVNRAGVEHHLTEEGWAKESRTVDNAREAAGHFHGHAVVLVANGEIQSERARHAEIILQPSVKVPALHGKGSETAAIRTKTGITG